MQAMTGLDISGKRPNAQAVSGYRLFAADVGGTHARLAVIDADVNGNALSIHHYKKYRNLDFPSLAAIVEDFVAATGPTGIKAATLASAGYVVGDDLIATNLPWSVKLSDIRDKLGLADICTINDFVAVAYGTRHLKPEETVILNKGAKTSPRDTIGVMGPGTGLGAAVLAHSGDTVLALNTEAGQASLAPVTDREIELLKALKKRHSFVSLETALSGPGLLRLYHAMADVTGRAAGLETPEAVSAAGLEGSDQLAAETLEQFCELMGSAAGDFALAFGARGGFYLAGGILPSIRDYLLASRFMERFADKGAMRPFLEDIPVRLIDHGQLGVIGAAGWYVNTELRV
ncbi:glucokinase [Pseudokordiimonas caeni]|uniref:glucokinase n=1 Tax=Pseudokordiimonas caeni TaxID=2997908 RepID=UPI002810D99A|nr:glucokinase [Pseudokordiimonas caeni]